jgi:hypothetical protein
MTKAEKTKHIEDYKACFRNVCTDFIKGDYKRASYIHEHIKRMCLLNDGERVTIEKKILKDYKIEWGNFAERVILKYF